MPSDIILLSILSKMFLGVRKMTQDILEKLAESDFRKKFNLKDSDKAYIKQKGIETIEKHAKDFISKRIAPAIIKNDGKQTPMKGHPVFIAQHATATCCRKCISKWHKFRIGVELSEDQQKYIVSLIMRWIKLQLK